jgi:hypothetical protein
MTEHDIPAWTPHGELTALPTYTPPSELRALGAASGKPVHVGVDFAAGPDRTVRWPANDNYPRLVALTGAAGSGKSTATRYLVEHHGYTLVKFAGPLKDMCRALGLDDRQIEGDLKEVPCDILAGRTPRHAMQTLGTQWGRDCIAEDFWIRLWKMRSVQHKRVVVDDCRFPNEAEAVRKLGGIIIKLEGRGGIAGNHASEAGCGQHDAVVVNDGCVTELYAAVEQEVRGWAA